MDCCWISVFIVLTSTNYGTCESSQPVYVVEGDKASVPCTYKESNFRSLMWYRQYPGEKLDLLIQIYNDGNKTEGRFTAELQQQQSSSVLYIPATRVTDSALYVCAVEAQCEELCGRQCKNTVLLDEISE
ncbi:hypothetical protein XELAEV_18010266mg [Xenopus laevis]|uniref:Ig-like domain-containing protein n=1 Tax=Xenopus laevis TaxID=8355 RepID=A0A974DU57_XENLA|nr:hypothetical protein XELAEV_18010266mg [Xenopus laevis]